MKTTELLVRCYAEQRDGQWQAFCLDLSLAAQADTLVESRSKLEDMICEYVYDALAGEDQAYAAQMLSRRAPWQLWAKYYFWKAAHQIVGSTAKMAQFFIEPLPLTPSSRCHV